MNTKAKYTEKPRRLDRRDIITSDAHAVFWTKDGLWHVARPDATRGSDMYWTNETYKTREAALTALASCAAETPSQGQIGYTFATV